jgi:4-hydroxymandelate oxidase
MPNAETFLTVAAAHDLGDFEHAAAAVLSRDVWDFVAGGSGGELTLAANRTALERLFVIPRTLRDVSECSTVSTLLGRPVALPLAVAPVAYHRLVHPDGERAVARAAKAAGVPFAAAMLSSVPIEEITEVGGAVWFQMYWLRDRAKTLDLARRAENAGCEALMLTVDVPWMGRRLRDVRNGFALPDGVRAANLNAGAETTANRQTLGVSAVATHTTLAFSAAVTWACVAELRSVTRLPIVLKGILAPQDAARAVEFGVDAVVVSNHGGRQLDGAIPSADALAGVAAAVGGKCEVWMDGGIRGGSDVLKALVLGADGVLVGRPPIWGLAAAGEAGVARVLDLLADEFHNALGLAGCDGVVAARQLRIHREAAGHAAGLTRHAAPVR